MSLVVEPGGSSAGNEGPRLADGSDLRIVYRTGAGAIHHDWPCDRLAEALGDSQGTVWVDIRHADVSDPRILDEFLRETFGFHPLAVDDALRETHLPKLDDWGDYLYTVFHDAEFHHATARLTLRELDLFLGPNYLVSIHADPIPLLEHLPDQFEREAARATRNLGADHLLYAMLDQGIANYLRVVDRIDDAIDDAQDEVLARPTTATLQQIFAIKRGLLRFHRLLMAQREVIHKLARDPYPPIDDQDRVYFRDLYDHMVRLHDITETLRDMVSSAVETYLSSVSNRTNEIMKALTVVTVMVLPLNFMVGFFGMNFFGEAIELRTLGVHKTWLFVLTCLFMMVAPLVVGYGMKRRGWF